MLNTIEMKEYQTLLADYLICRRDGDHPMAAELAKCMAEFWTQQDDVKLAKKWLKSYEEHYLLAF